MIIRSLKFWVISAVISGMLIVAWLLIIPSGSDVIRLTHAPENRPMELSSGITDSRVRVSFQYPLDALALALDQQHLEEVVIRDQVSARCRNPVNCARDEYVIKLSPGHFKIAAPHGAVISINSPVVVSGKGLANKDDFTRRSRIRNFQTRLYAGVSIKLQHDENGCITFTSQPEIQWNGPSRVNVFKDARIDIHGVVEKRLKSELEIAGMRLKSSLFRCADISHALQTAGRSMAFSLGESGQSLLIVPRSLQFEAIKIEDEYLWIHYQMAVSSGIIGSTPEY